MGELYEYIDSWNGVTVFTYIVILFIIVWFFSKTSMQNNIYIGIVIAAFIVSYLNNKAVVAADTSDDIKKIKNDGIKPKLNEEAGNHDEILSLLFSIQDIYSYNPQQYEVMVKSINNFYELFKLSYIDGTTVFFNYDMMKQYKRDALNALKSIIFSVQVDDNIHEKVNVSTVALDDIMTIDLDKISYLADDRIYRHGYDVNTKIISEVPKAFNEYDDIFKNFSYEVY
jgi:hypothetical protein